MSARLGAHRALPGRESNEPDSDNFLDARLRFDGSIEQIDEALRNIASELTTRDVAIGQLAERFWKADLWRRLGYATESQYARERLGMSLSALEAKRRLARKLERLPRLAAAIRERELGYEAARVVAQVATPETVEQWVERAAERTVRCLRDEVDAAEMVARVTDERAIDPPSEELMSELERVDLEFRSRGGADIDENVSSLCTWCHLEGIHGGRLAAEPPASGIRWSIGRTVHTVVEGRRRVTAPSRRRIFGSLRVASCNCNKIKHMCPP